MFEESVELTNELLKRIFGNVGAVPGKNFGKVGITTRDFIIDQKCKIEYEDSEIKEYNIYVGELQKPGEKYQIALTNTGTLSNPEFVMVLMGSEDNGIIFGFRLFWGDEMLGSMMQKLEDKWVPISTLARLNITAAIELLTQEGFVWQPCKEPVEELVNNLLLILEY